MSEASAHQTNSVELVVGAFLVLGLGALAWLAVALADIRILPGDEYEIIARFVSSSGLKPGAFVEVGGVRVGRVSDIELDYDSYEAVVTMALDGAVVVQDDAIASIRTSGIIGDKFVRISPGGSDVLLGDGGELFETESSINLEELISKYVFESGD